MAVSTFPCANCDGEVTVKDNLNGGLIAVNVDGRAKAAHRECPEEESKWVTAR